MVGDEMNQTRYARCVPFACKQALAVSTSTVTGRGSGRLRVPPSGDRSVGPGFRIYTRVYIYEEGA